MRGLSQPVAVPWSRVVSRETTSGNQTTTYDARGRNVGRLTGTSR
jgi:hypothetical protein